MSVAEFRHSRKTENVLCQFEDVAHLHADYLIRAVEIYLLLLLLCYYYPRCCCRRR